MSCSSTEDSWEGGLQVADIGLDGGGRPRLTVVSGSESRGLVLFLHLAGDRLLGVFLVLGEWSQRLVVTDSRWVRRLERFVVLHWGRGLRHWLALWVLVIVVDREVRVEMLRLFHFLREGLLLHELGSLEALLSSELLGTIVVVLHVGDHATERCLFANFTDLGRVGKQIAWPNHNFTIVLLRSEVLLNVLEFLHVLVSCIGRLSNVLGWPEGFLVAILDLLGSVLFSKHGLGSFFEGITDGIVAGLLEDDTVACALLDGIGANIGRVNLDLLHLGVGDQARLLLLELGVTDCQRGRRREQSKSSWCVVELTR